MSNFAHNAVVQAVRAVGLLSVAVCLIPTGAHLAELSSKMAMAPAEYMIVQRIYAGWALFGVPIAVALAATFASAAFTWSDREQRCLSLGAFACVAATQVIFWTFTFPMNLASHNWTSQPPDFEASRRQWEYSHAASGILMLCALCCLVLAAVRRRRCR